ncbi:DUF4167 domain-containing protein [Sphingobium aquiterrae]|uniref:DUF4167 domain-containing protein n=1 Tax=Sphingobium aquiterrae TaxID=2038656 RepID=UPI003015F552
MINNRQAGRRNRGRNNGRPNGNNRGGGDNGNRIDSRARGNATQLLEKYKNMARDAQLAGDRVNAEYYLQYADHYFRVLADNRARMEEQQARHRRPDDNSFDDDGDDFDNAMDNGDDFGSDFEERAPVQNQRDGYRQSQPQPQPQQRDDRNRNRNTNRRDPEARDVREPRDGRERDNRERDGRDRDGRERDGRDQAARPPREREAPRIVADAPAPVQEEIAPVQAPVAEQPVEAQVAPRRRGRPPKVRTEAVSEDLVLDIAVLPPAISRADNDAAEIAEEDAPRKRTRRVRRPAEEAAE